jgi:hypothetical protein
MDDFDPAGIAENQTHQQTHDAINERSANRSPKARNVKSLDHLRGKPEHEAVYHKYEEANCQNRERERNQDEDWPDEGIEYAKDYSCEDQREDATDLDSGH